MTEECGSLLTVAAEKRRPIDTSHLKLYLRTKNQASMHDRSKIHLHLQYIRQPPTLFWLVAVFVVFEGYDVAAAVIVFPSTTLNFGSILTTACRVDDQNL